MRTITKRLWRAGTRLRRVTPYLAAAATLVALTGTAPGPAWAQGVIAEYDFQTGSPTVPGKLPLQSNDSELNSLAGIFTTGPGLVPGVGVSLASFGDTGPDVGNPSDNTSSTSMAVSDFFATATNLAQAIANQDYLSFLITANPGFEMDLQALTFTGAISGPDPPDQVAVLSSVTGFSAPASLLNATLTTVVPGAPGTDFQDFTVNLSGNPLFQNLTSPTEFRFYFFDGGAGSGSSSFLDNVVLSGTVAPTAPLGIIPEPGTAALLASGLLCAGAQVLPLVGVVIRNRRARRAS